MHDAGADMEGLQAPPLTTFAPLLVRNRTCENRVLIVHSDTRRPVELWKIMELSKLKLVLIYVDMVIRLVLMDM